MENGSIDAGSAASEEKPRVFTVDEVAKRLRIGRTLAYELAKRGELPGVIRLGTRYRVSAAAIEALEEGGA